MSSSGSVVMDTVAHTLKVSMWDLFSKADPFVQGIMIALIVVSIWVWALILSKASEVKKIKNHSQQFEEMLWREETLEKACVNMRDSKLSTPMVRIFSSAMDIRESLAEHKGLTKHLETRLYWLVRAEISRMSRYVSFLATVASIAPFIGLLGTVWGIMDSFQSIANTKNTNLAVVAPGIAEALMATAFGLIAAIPALVGYNYIKNRIDYVRMRLEAFAEELIVIIGGGV